MDKIELVENMPFPPSDVLRWKMAEHSAWYSGDPNVLATFYNQMLATNITGLPYMTNRDRFWARQVEADVEIGFHVPLAGDISSTSADLIFNEPPIIKISEAYEEKATATNKKSQETLDLILDNNSFFSKIVEGGEVCSAIGGVFVKLAWDKDLSPYPIPVIEQADSALAEFRFGHLVKVAFWETFLKDDAQKDYFRLFEIYSKDGSIDYKLFKGSIDKLGREVSLDTLEETKDLEPVQTKIDDILCVYVPNVLPNRLKRASNFGRSDYSGIEGIMDCLDETYSSWMKDILLAQGKVIVPESFLQLKDGKTKYNFDQLAYAKMDIDPTVEGSKITAIQFQIRAMEFEKTSLNLLDRAISSAGYSPQSFGLQIEGRAESGTALTVRERKSLATKKKKELYWDYAIRKLTKLTQLIYVLELKGRDMELNNTITAQFNDSIANNINETSEALQKISAASAASTETMVRMLHPDWGDDEVLAEVAKIKEDKSFEPLQDPLMVGVEDEEEEEEENEEEEE